MNFKLWFVFVFNTLVWYSWLLGGGCFLLGKGVVFVLGLSMCRWAAGKKWLQLVLYFCFKIQWGIEHCQRYVAAWCTELSRCSHNSIASMSTIMRPPPPFSFAFAEVDKRLAVNDGWSSCEDGERKRKIEMEKGGDD